MALVSPRLTQEETADLVDAMAQLFPRGDVRAVCTMGLNAADIPLGIGARPWRDLEHADLVVSVGQDLTQFAPVAGVRIRTARRASGGRLAVLDARDTLLGSEADLWLRPAGAHLPAVLAALGGLLVSRAPGAAGGAPGRRARGGLRRRSPRTRSRPPRVSPPGRCAQLAAHASPRRRRRSSSPTAAGSTRPGRCRACSSRSTACSAAPRPRGSSFCGPTATAAAPRRWWRPRNPNSTARRSCCSWWPRTRSAPRSPARRSRPGRARRNSSWSSSRRSRRPPRPPTWCCRCSAFAEKDGTFVAGNGVVQHLEAALTPAGCACPRCERP